MSDTIEFCKPESKEDLFQGKNIGQNYWVRRMEYRKTKRKGIQPKPCSESELLTLCKFDNINCIFRELDEKGDWVFPILDMEINPNDHHVEAGRGIYYPINPEAETLIYNSMLSLV